MGSFKNYGVYDMDDNEALQMLKRPGFTVFSYDLGNIGKKQEEFVEKIIKNTKKEAK